MALLCSRFSGKKTEFIPAVQTVDIYRISEKTKTAIWAQSADAKKPYKNTGYITPYALRQAGAAGFFINHSDCPKALEEIKELIAMAKAENLKTLVFAKSIEELKQYDIFGADFLSWEDPALIASETAMVDKYKESLSTLIASIKTPFVVGAGIRTREHYEKSLRLGAVGVVLSSQVLEAPDPASALHDLAA